MDEKEKKFRELLKRVRNEHTEKGMDNLPYDASKIDPFVDEMKTIELVGDYLVWMN